MRTGRGDDGALGDELLAQFCHSFESFGCAWFDDDEQFTCGPGGGDETTGMRDAQFAESVGEDDDVVRRRYESAEVGGGPSRAAQRWMIGSKRLAEAE